MRTRNRRKSPVPLNGKRPSWNVNYRDKVLKDLGYNEEEELRRAISTMVEASNLSPEDIRQLTTTDDDEAVRAMDKMNKDETLLSMIFPWILAMATSCILLQNHVRPDVIFIVVSAIAAIRFLHHLKVIYGNIKGWQVTILTKHISPIVIMKCCFSNSSLPAYAVMIAFQVAVEMPLDIYTSVYVVAQLIAMYLHDIAPQRVEDVLIVLNIIIPTGFWSAVLFSGMFGDAKKKAFHTLDREMRKVGLIRSLYNVPVAFVRELWFHFLSQYMVMSFFLSRDGNLYSRRTSIIRDVMSLYIAWVLVCYVVSPNKMPYPVVPPKLFRGLAVLSLFYICLFN